MKRKSSFILASICCLVFVLVMLFPNKVFAGVISEVQALNDTWLSDLTNGFSCTSSEIIGSEPGTIFLDSDETVNYWIEFAATEEEGLVLFDLTSIILAKYEDSISQSLSFTVMATKADSTTESSSFIWAADDGSSKEFTFSTMTGISKFRIEVTDSFDAYNLEYWEFTVENPVSGNSPPIITNFTSSHFLENTLNAFPQQLDSDITVLDTDSSDLDGGQVVVSYSGAGLTEDQLSIGSYGSISLSEPDVIYASVGVIGTVSGGMDGSSLIISLNASATPERVTELLRALTYYNTSNEPTSYRTISVTLSDGDGGTSFAVTAQMSVTGEADPGMEFPYLVQDTNSTWISNLNNGFTITANEGTTIHSGINNINITSIGPSGSFNIKAAEQLTGNVFELTSVDFHVVNPSSSTYMMTFTGYKGNGDTVSASVSGQSLEDFSAIDISTFREISSFDFRVTRITGSEGIDVIRIASFTIANPKVYSENSSPVVTGLSDVLFMENDVNAVYSQIDSDITFTDSDSIDLDGGTITISYTDSALSEDQLWVGDIGNISVSGSTIIHATAGVIATVSGGNDGTNLIITMNSTATPDYATEILRALIYRNTSNEPNSYRNIKITASDGDGGTAAIVSAKISVWGQAESGVDIPSLTQNLYRDWNLDHNNGFSSFVSTGTITGNSTMIWFINNNSGTISFTPDEQFYGGMFDLSGIEFDIPTLSTDTYTVTVTGHTNYETIVASSIGGSSEVEINSIDLSNMLDLISFDITITGLSSILNVGIVSFTITNAVISNSAPVFTTADAFSISETASVDGTILLDVDANNGDGGDDDEELTYSITGGTALEYFSINALTGEIVLNTTGASSLDYETVESYTIIVRANDGKIINNITNQTITVSLVNEDDEAPIITSNGGMATATVNINENTTYVATVTADDVDTSGDLTYFVSGGADSISFAITSAGVLSFITAPDYETKYHYQIIIEVSDGARSDFQSIEINILDVNEFAPEITSNGGENTANITIDENTYTVTTVTATDNDIYDIITYEISGGTDQGDFTINASTGVLSLLNPPNYETKSEYSVIIKVLDGTKDDIQNITIFINNIDETAPVITSDGSGDIAYICINENATAITTVTASDVELLDILSYTIIGGVDFSSFQIDAVSGELTFIEAPDYETQVAYEVTVEVSDGVNSDSQTIHITIINQNDIPPVITSNEGEAVANIEVAENSIAVMTVTAVDADELGSLSYSISGGADFSSLQIDAVTGEVTFIEAPDYETQEAYEVIVEVSDGIFQSTQMINIAIINQNDNTPEITSNGGESESIISVLENQRAVSTITATDIDKLEEIKYYVSGVDASKFNIDSLSGVLTLIIAADYEWKSSYEIIITASDGTYNDMQTLHINIVDVVETKGDKDDKDDKDKEDKDKEDKDKDDKDENSKDENSKDENDKDNKDNKDNKDDDTDKMIIDMVINADRDLILDAKSLEEAKNNDKDLYVNIKDEDGREKYSWIFNKENLLSSNNNMTDVNLSLEISQIRDNERIMDDLGEDDGVAGLVISFAHSGILPAQATVQIYVGDQEGIIPGDKIYLYHYNHDTGKLETLPYSSNYIVNHDGYITITILHCSDYVLLHEKAKSGLISSLKDQCSIAPLNKTIYLGDYASTVTIHIKLPVTLELVGSFLEKTSQPMIGRVTVTYYSSNKHVATVDNEGRITARGIGKAVIFTNLTLYSGKIKETKITITVKEPYIRITEERSTMELGEAFTFNAAAYGVDAEDIVWTTAKKSIIVIDKKTGRAIAKSRGIDYVIASIGDISVKIKVIVK